MMGRWVSA